MEMLKILVPIPVLAALLVAGCGGDKELSKADFAKQGNAVCTKFNAKMKTIAEPTSMAGVAKYAESVGSEFDTLISDLKGIKAPKDQSDDYDALVQTAEDAKTQTDKMKAAKTEADVTKISAESETADKKSDALALKLGLTECAQN